MPSCLSAEHCAINNRPWPGCCEQTVLSLHRRQWLTAIRASPRRRRSEKRGANHEWRHLYNERVMSMPDTWEYLVRIVGPRFSIASPRAGRSEFAKTNSISSCRMVPAPERTDPAYEWNFSDVNPPVIAWRQARLSNRTQAKRQRRSRILKPIFHKMLIAFTWWVNRKDLEGNMFSEGGFLGLDNIGVFDRNYRFPTARVSSKATAPVDGNVFSQPDAHRDRARDGKSRLRKHRGPVFETFSRIARGHDNLGGRGSALE